MSFPSIYRTPLRRHLLVGLTLLFVAGYVCTLLGLTQSAPLTVPAEQGPSNQFSAPDAAGAMASQQQAFERRLVTPVHHQLPSHLIGTHVDPKTPPPSPSSPPLPRPLLRLVSPSPVRPRWRHSRNSPSETDEEDSDHRWNTSRTLQPATSECLQGGGSGSAGASLVGGGGVALDLLVLILSSQQKMLRPGRRRGAVRRSWAHASSELGMADAEPRSRCSVRYVFIIGGGRRSKLHMLSDDVISLPVADGYRNITEKVVSAMRWAASTVAFRYVLKTDDDSFVCVARLLELLRPMPRKRLYMGIVNPHHNVIGGDSSTRYERWRDPEYVTLFNRSVYAPYMQGAGCKQVPRQEPKRPLALPSVKPLAPTSPTVDCLLTNAAMSRVCMEWHGARQMYSLRIWSHWLLRGRRHYRACLLSKTHLSAHCSRAWPSLWIDPPIFAIRIGTTMP
jgi:hypothetical protein